MKLWCATSTGFLCFTCAPLIDYNARPVWVESLEGGLAYLQEVVIEDSLGLAAELESQMSMVVDTYQCEWKTTIEDPEQLRRFQTYVNSDATDSDVIFVRERGQRRPITEDERRYPLPS